MQASRHPAAPAGRQDWARRRYLVHMDGQACSSKLEQALPLGSLVFKEESGLGPWYRGLLVPFVVRPSHWPPHRRSHLPSHRANHRPSHPPSHRPFHRPFHRASTHPQ